MQNLMSILCAVGRQVLWSTWSALRWRSEDWRQSLTRPSELSFALRLSKMEAGSAHCSEGEETEDQATRILWSVTLYGWSCAKLELLWNNSLFVRQELILTDPKQAEDVSWWVKDNKFQPNFLTKMNFVWCLPQNSDILVMSFRQMEKLNEVTYSSREREFIHFQIGM